VNGVAVNGPKALGPLGRSVPDILALLG